MHALIKFSPDKKEQSYKPGPGNYDPDPLKTKKTEPQFKVGSSTRIDLGFQKKLLFQQDPGSYNPDFAATKSSASKWVFGTDKRKNMVNRDAPGFPGAGSYSIPSKVSEGPKYGMSVKLTSEIDASPVKKNPGPGSYDL